MTDDQMVSKLRSMEQWVTKEPWKSIADRLEELIKIYRLEEHISEGRLSLIQAIVEEHVETNQNNLIDK